MNPLGNKKEPLVPKINIPRPGGNQTKPKDESLFGGQSFTYEGGWSGVERSLRRDPRTRKEIEKIIKIGNPSKKVTQADITNEIQKLEDRVDIRNDDKLTKSEVKLGLKKEAWKAKLEEKKKNMFNYKDRSDVQRRKKEDQFLKDKFGIK